MSGEIKNITIQGKSFPVDGETKLGREMICNYRITRKDKYSRYLAKKLNKVFFLSMQIKNISGKKICICLSKKYKIYEKYGIIEKS